MFTCLAGFTFDFLAEWRPGLQHGLYHGAFFNPSHFTTQEPSVGKPGAWVCGAPSQPAAIMATA